MTSGLTTVGVCKMEDTARRESRSWHLFNGAESSDSKGKLLGKVTKTLFIIKWCQIQGHDFLLFHCSRDALLQFLL